MATVPYARLELGVPMPLEAAAPVDLPMIASLYNEEDDVALLYAAIVAAIRPRSDQPHGVVRVEC